MSHYVSSFLLQICLFRPGNMQIGMNKTESQSEIRNSSVTDGRMNITEFDM